MSVVIEADLQRMLDTATAFFLAGERCAPDLKFGPYGTHSVIAPRIANYAFAVELTLKILYQVSTKNCERGYNLKSLFEKLPQEVRGKLPYLEQCADEIAQYFENWRYPFEHDFLTGDFDNPRRAFIECYREIRSINPSLASIYERNWGSFEPDWYWAWIDLELTQIERDPQA